MLSTTDPYPEVRIPTPLAVAIWQYLETFLVVITEE